MKSQDKKRVAIFIDGGNFYQRIRQDDLIPKGVKFDYAKFAGICGFVYHKTGCNVSYINYI